MGRRKFSSPFRLCIKDRGLGLANLEVSHPGKGPARTRSGAALSRCPSVRRHTRSQVAQRFANPAVRDGAQVRDRAYEGRGRRLTAADVSRGRPARIDESCVGG